MLIAISSCLNYWRIPLRGIENANENGKEKGKWESHEEWHDNAQIKEVQIKQ